MMLTVFAHLIERDGYGEAGIHTVAALGRLGLGIRAVDLSRGGTFGEPGDQEWWAKGKAVAMSTPPWWAYIRADRLLGFTMCESTEIPRDFLAALRSRADAVIVPCKFCTEVFRAATTVPVYQVPLGVAPEAFTWHDRGGREGRPYTFLWSGTPDYRKGWDVAYRAFYQAFGKRPDVRLVMHFRLLPRGLRGSRDGNVELIEGSISHGEWVRLLREADCYVAPSRGEGWGLPPREAAATGLPVLATNWGGLAEEIERWALPVAVAGMAPATFGPWEAGEIGEWAQPDIEALIEGMRWCEAHREEALAFGRRASEWLAERGTWAETARGIVRAVGAL